MKSTIHGILLLLCAACPAFGQSDDAPVKFEAADVRVSPQTQNQFVRARPVHAGRYDVAQASMLDLIHIAYNFNYDKVLGGPSWLEMDRYDISAKVPPESSPDALKTMLQNLLADRFKLVVHKETKPMPAYMLTVGKKPQLKQADGTEDSGCKPAAPNGPREGTIRLMAAGGDGNGGTSFTLGPGGTVQWECRNMTMAAFAMGLPSMFGSQLGSNPVIDDTGLKGGWNFDVRWSIGMMGPGMGNQGEHVTVFEALDKQIGLKLEERPVPTPVIVVDSVNRKPSDNPPGTVEILPPVTLPTEFEVASVKPADPNERSSFRPMAAGRYTGNGLPLRRLVIQALGANLQDIVGLPSWVDTERFDIVAKAPGDPAMYPPGMEAIAPMLKALLVDRFKLAYHTEERTLPAFTLTAGKPKMKKADPASRTFCHNGRPPAGSPPGSQLLTCQNITMEQFVDHLRYTAPELNVPVADATGLEGGWDFTLLFSFNVMMPFNMRGGDAAAGAATAAPDPNGGLTIFEAVEKELGLKLEKQKRPVTVIVIDHIEQKPTEN
ncbi:MAG TPA: TIGR03435 family protein [Bryobacteraceae bacterium]|jgi:uncharacterized protein (TIGR03435 family)|nr:TIGR03435 family protein [Bryobacteraceae bacterium]